MPEFFKRQTAPGETREILVQHKARLLTQLFNSPPEQLTEHDGLLMAALAGDPDIKAIIQPKKSHKNA